MLAGSRVLPRGSVSSPSGIFSAGYHVYVKDVAGCRDHIDHSLTNPFGPLIYELFSPMAPLHPTGQCRSRSSTGEGRSGCNCRYGYVARHHRDGTGCRVT